MRCCIPLDRVSIKGISDYHSFATLVGLVVSLDDNTRVQWRLDSAIDFNALEPLKRSDSYPRRSFSTALPFKLFPSSRDSSPDRRPESPRLKSDPRTQTEPSPRHMQWDAPHSPQTFTFNVAVLNEQAWFAKAFEAAVKSSSQRKFRPGTVRPRMVLEIAGHNCLAADDEVELEPVTAEEDDEESRLATTRKAEKALLAAKMFGLDEDSIFCKLTPQTSRLTIVKRCYVSHGLVPARGHIILTPKYVCFWRRANVGADIKYRFKAKDIKGAVPCPGMRARFHGMALQIHGSHDLKFDFWQQASRDEVVSRIQELCKVSPGDPPRLISPSPSLYTSSSEKTAHAADVLAPTQDAMAGSRAFPDEALTHMPFVANRPIGSRVKLTPRTFTCLTIGSRGDVQPYIALGLRLIKDGHKVVIVTHGECDS